MVQKNNKYVIQLYLMSLVKSACILITGQLYRSGPIPKVRGKTVYATQGLPGRVPGRLGS
jgi:hypothetical protein